MTGQPTTKHFCSKCWSVSCQHCQAVTRPKRGEETMTYIPHDYGTPTVYREVKCLGCGQWIPSMKGTGGLCAMCKASGKQGGAP